MSSNQLKLSNSRGPIFIAEDDPLLALGYLKIAQRFAPVVHASSLVDAQEQIELLFQNQSPPSMAIIDLHLGLHSQEGLKIVEACQQKQIPCFVLSSSNESQAIEMAYRLGCRHFLNKLKVKEELSHYLNQFFITEEKLWDELFKNELITSDSKLKSSIMDLLNQNLVNQSVFISGETGSGKGHLANFLHNHQDIPGDFISLHCAEISENLIESELFGHEKGSFTGADKSYEGRIRKSHQGTLFLDEVATLSLQVQVKLLKAIDERKIFPVGGNKPHPVDFTLFAASWESMEEKISQGKFREDLWYRLLGHKIHIPALRDRRPDILLLLDYFMEKLPRKFYLTRSAKDKLLNYSWPGNIRELQKVVKSISFFAKGIVEADDIVLKEYKNILNEKKSVSETPQLPPLNLDFVKSVGLPQYLELIENQYVKFYLEEEKANVTKVIKDLKLSSARFYRIQKSIQEPLQN